MSKNKYKSYIVNTNLDNIQRITHLSMKSKQSYKTSWKYNILHIICK